MGVESERLTSQEVRLAHRQHSDPRCPASISKLLPQSRSKVPQVSRMPGPLTMQAYTQDLGVYLSHCSWTHYAARSFTHF